MINKVLIVLCVGIVFVLGYWAYLDTQNKRHQELMQIIQEAEKKPAKYRTKSESCSSQQFSFVSYATIYRREKIIF